MDRVEEIGIGGCASRTHGCAALCLRNRGLRRRQSHSASIHQGNMKHLHILFLGLLMLVVASTTIAAVLPCTSPEDCPQYWTEERAREHLERCWRMDWCQKLMRQALEELRLERLAQADTVVKKDVFSSRGWAAGGLPSHFTFFNNRKILQQQHDQQKQEQQHDSKKVRQPRFTPSQGMSLVADSRIFEEDLEEKTQPPEPPQAQISQPKVENAQYHHRNYSSLPQLFVSYGWGPLGK